MKLLSKVLDHADRRAVLMRRMLDRLQIDDAALVGGALALNMHRVVSRCRWCAQAEACQRWLDGGAGDRHDFCPNASAFDALRRA